MKKKLKLLLYLLTGQCTLTNDDETVFIVYQHTPPIIWLFIFFPIAINAYIDFTKQLETMH